MTQWQEKFAVNFSCHYLNNCSIVSLFNRLLKKKQYSNLLNNCTMARKVRDEIFLPLFNNCHCLIDCLKKTIEQLIKQWYNGKKSSRELFLPLFNNCHCLIDCLKKTIEQLIK